MGDVISLYQKMINLPYVYTVCKGLNYEPLVFFKSLCTTIMKVFNEARNELFSEGWRITVAILYLVICIV